MPQLPLRRAQEAPTAARMLAARLVAAVDAVGHAVAAPIRMNAARPVVHTASGTTVHLARVACVLAVRVAADLSAFIGAARAVEMAVAHPTRWHLSPGTAAGGVLRAIVPTSSRLRRAVRRLSTLAPYVAVAAVKPLETAACPDSLMSLGVEPYELPLPSQGARQLIGCARRGQQ